MKKVTYFFLIICFGLFTFLACSKRDSKLEQVNVSEGISAEDLTGKSLFIYCGAGMTKPFTEITDAFQNETGATLEVTYANAAQIITQITTSEKGDLFIAGDEGELAPIENDYVEATKSLVKHIPVIAVQKGNPKGITGLKDFAKEGVTIVLGDNKATPIGKIADKALKEAGIFEKVNIAARTATAPEIITALSMGQCDAVIVWKENTGADGVEVLESADMDPYIKTIPAASLSCGTNKEVLEAFLDYLDSNAAKDIWKSYGYEVIN